MEIRARSARTDAGVDSRRRGDVFAVSSGRLRCGVGQGNVRFRRDKVEKGIQGGRGGNPAGRLTGFLQDVLVLFYAPRCVFCTVLTPLLLRLAHALRHNNQLLIAR